MQSYLKKILLLTCFSGLYAYSQIPAKGDSSKLEIANWNIEWFGKTGSGYGPSDEALQNNNVISVIRDTKLDIWGLCEIANTNAFDSLMDSLPEYGSVVSTYLPEQKTGVIYNTARFAFIGSQLLGTLQKDSFTTGRFPLLVALKPLYTSSIDTLFVIVIHLKANIGSSSEKLAAYNSRMRSSEWLNHYLSQTMTKRYCIVLGDWNDDLDASIYNALPSPYANLRDNTFGFTFITQTFTDNHIGTTTSYPDAIDHQFISSPLKKLWVNASTELLKLNQYISNYSTTTSDHYPVYAHYTHQSTAVSDISASKAIQFYPNPATNTFVIGFEGIIPADISIFNSNGQCVLKRFIYSGESINTETLPSGIYTVSIIISGSISHHLIAILH